MECGRGYGGGTNLIPSFENSNNSLWVPSPSPSFHETMVNFDQEPHKGRRASIKRDYNGDNIVDEENDSNPFQSEKKRRLSPEQVQYLEKSFENENKLEPERKVKLAKELGLEPRQVAIWFQNRRARYKTKQLEKEYGSLKANYDHLKLDFDSLSKERDHLQNEVKVLTKKLKQRDEVNPGNMLHSNTIIPKMEIGQMDKAGLVIVPSTNKQSMEDSSSAKSDIVDSESPHCTNGNHFSLMDDPIDQQSNFSQEEEEHLMMTTKMLLLPPPPPPPPPPLPSYNDFLKVEDNECYDPNASSCNILLVDDQPFWSMLY